MFSRVSRIQKLSRNFVKNSSNFTKRSTLSTYVHSTKSNSINSNLKYLFGAALITSTSLAFCEDNSPQPPKNKVYTRKEIVDISNKKEALLVTFNGKVYNITDFVKNHPGGKDKILLAVGKDVGDFWNVYRSHYKSDTVKELLKEMEVGTLAEEDYKRELEEANKKSDVTNVYRDDPILSPIMKVYSKEPINAESPLSLATDSWTTPNDLFFVRNHHPVENLSDKNYYIKISIDNKIKNDQNVQKILKFNQIKHQDNKNIQLENPKSPSFDENSLLLISQEELKKKFREHSVVSTVQCGGNRRQALSNIKKTSGTDWTNAISTAKFTGIYLKDLLEEVGITEELINERNLKKINNNKNYDPELLKELNVNNEYADKGLLSSIKHVIFVSYDGLEASIPIKKALSTYGDVLLAYGMNDEPMPPKHGFPLRVIVPGHAGIRNVKWVKEIRLSSEEAEGTWQRGMAYKGFNPSITSLAGIKVEDIPSLQEQPVMSAITFPVEGEKNETKIYNLSELSTIKGFAYSGGGKNIIRVDVSLDNGKTWKSAQLKEGSEQPLDQAWAWTFWELDLNYNELSKIYNEAKSENNALKEFNILVKAIDNAHNSQPDNDLFIWNLRGINSNGIHRVTVKVTDKEDEN